MSDNNEIGSNLGDSVFLEQVVPLHWKQVSIEEIKLSIVDYNTKNAKTLGRLLAVGENVHATNPDSHGDGHELSKIEFKIDLLLDLITSLVSQQIQLHKKRRFRLYSSHLLWYNEKPLTFKPGDQLIMSVWISDDYPRPIYFFCTCEKITEEDGCYIANCQYKHFDANVQGLIEKIIFRYHRRAIAHRDG